MYNHSVDVDAEMVGFFSVLQMLPCFLSISVVCDINLLSLVSSFPYKICMFHLLIENCPLPTGFDDGVLKFTEPLMPSAVPFLQVLHYSWLVAPSLSPSTLSVYFFFPVSILYQMYLTLPLQVSECFLLWCITSCSFLLSHSLHMQRFTLSLALHILYIIFFLHVKQSYRNYYLLIYF